MRPVALFVALASCAAPGDEGTSINLGWSDLRGGFVFATSAISGSAGYDLYWAPIPNPSVVDPVGFIRLTESPHNEWQPSMASDASGMAFAREDGIFTVSVSGRINRITDTSEGDFRDSLPNVSPNAQRVVWVREDLKNPIPNTNFYETYIMIATFDGLAVEALNPTKGIVQDAPVFSPDPEKSMVAWSEFDPTSIVPGNGPANYGIYMFDYKAFSGHYICRAVDGLTPNAHTLPPPSDARRYRCFGQHLAWPIHEAVVVTQDLLEVGTNGMGLGTILPKILDTLAVQQTGFAITMPRRDGFHAAFPLSASYSHDERNLVVMDGVMGSLQGDEPTIAFVFTHYDGGAVYRVRISGLLNDLDEVNTGSFLFSLATPQIVPFFQ